MEIDTTARAFAVDQALIAPAVASTVTSEAGRPGRGGSGFGEQVEAD